MKDDTVQFDGNEYEVTRVTDAEVVTNEHTFQLCSLYLVDYGFKPWLWGTLDD